MTDTNAFRPVVGIDLGTTNSAIAHIRGGAPELIASPGGERIIPSVVLIDQNGRPVVGGKARASLVAMPDRTIAAVKRKMGSAEPIMLAGREWRPQDISAIILRELKSYADAHYGEGEKEAVITVPAYFTDEQRRATKEAGELAGFVVERIINEPTAAALAFGFAHTDEDRLLLVYDLGGGTFDVSVVELMSGIMEVKASTGDRMLGGEDFDWKLADWMAEQVLAEHGVDPRDDLRGKALLKEVAEQVKIELSFGEEARVSLPLVTVKNNRPVGLHVTISRDRFVSLIEDFLRQTIESVAFVLKDAGLAPRQIDDVLLVGGSTRIPRIREMIRDYFGKEPRADVHPDEAVALGAAVQAGLKSGAISKNRLIVTDVAPFSMGIAVLAESRSGKAKPGGYSKIIHRNSTIPLTETKRYYTSVPGQTAVSIEIYQGEHDWVAHNYRLGQFLLEGLPANWREHEAVDVTFRYNLNGILEVTGKSASTGKQMSVTVQDALLRDSREQYEESAAKLKALWEQADEPDEDDDDDHELDEPWLLDSDDDDEDEDNFDRFASAEEVREEAATLLQRAKEVAGTVKKKEAELIIRQIERLEEALADELSDEQLAELVDDMIDLLMEVEAT